MLGIVKIILYHSSYLLLALTIMAVVLIGGAVIAQHQTVFGGWQ